MGLLSLKRELKWVLPRVICRKNAKNEKKLEKTLAKFAPTLIIDNVL